jgi:hypothetical protein
MGCFYFHDVCFILRYLQVFWGLPQGKPYSVRQHEPAHALWPLWKEHRVGLTTLRKMEEAAMHTGPGVSAIHLPPPKEMKSLCLQLQNPKNKFPDRIINGFFCFCLTLITWPSPAIPHPGDFTG